ncbi:hypothetical protein ScalyP_jg11011 [Parmales sp. scaly parma]|nr:hypothetical protein ScalyP_jg11011 [Parmales sp. scaly parma]
MSFSLGVTDSMDMGLDDIISMRRKTAPKRTPVKKVVKKKPTAAEKSRGSAKAKKEAAANANRGLSKTKKPTKGSITAATHKMVNGHIVSKNSRGSISASRTTGSRTTGRKVASSKRKVVVKRTNNNNGNGNGNGNGNNNNNNNNNNNFGRKVAAPKAIAAVTKTLAAKGIQAPKGQKVVISFVKDTNTTFQGKGAKKNNNNNNGNGNGNNNNNNNNNNNGNSRNKAKPKAKAKVTPTKAKGAARGSAKKTASGKMTPRSGSTKKKVTANKGKKQDKFNSRRT